MNSAHSITVLIRIDGGTPSEALRKVFGALNASDLTDYETERFVTAQYANTGARVLTEDELNTLEAEVIG